MILRLCVHVIALAALLAVPTPAHAQAVRLPVTAHRQIHPLSCEAASLKTALQTVGINVPEAELVARLPRDPTPKQPGIWGNPHRGFVGSITGRMLIDGYGVYWEPIAALGSNYARTEIMQHGSPQQLAQAVTAGNPVIIWGYYGTRAVYNWHTPDGTLIKAVNGEHTRVVYGFDGPVDNPSRFYLVDPIYGELSWSTEQLMHNWSSLNHMGVVVSRHPRWLRLPNDTKVWEVNRDGTQRHWVTTWAAFTSRGGHADAVQTVDAATLNQYSIGAPIN